MKHLLYTLLVAVCITSAQAQNTYDFSCPNVEWMKTNIETNSISSGIEIGSPKPNGNILFSGSF